MGSQFNSSKSAGQCLAVLPSCYAWMFQYTPGYIACQSLCWGTPWQQSPWLFMKWNGLVRMV